MTSVHAKYTCKKNFLFESGLFAFSRVAFHLKSEDFWKYFFHMKICLKTNPKDMPKSPQVGKPKTSDWHSVAWITELYLLRVLLGVCVCVSNSDLYSLCEDVTAAKQPGLDSSSTLLT